MNPAAQLAITRRLRRHESCGPAGDYQAAEQRSEERRVGKECRCRWWAGPEELTGRAGGGVCGKGWGIGRGLKHCSVEGEAGVGSKSAGWARPGDVALGIGA